jgi:hypothetical protein
MTQFALKIGSDVVNFLSLTTSEDGVPVNEHDVLFFEVLNSDPVIIDISDFVYNPYLDSEWDGLNFVDFENREPSPMPTMSIGHKKFAFVVDNKYKLFYGLADVPQNEMLIAALSSNPKVIVR